MPPIPGRDATACALVAATRADQDKLSQALTKVGEEDVGFTYERDHETGDLGRPWHGAAARGPGHPAPEAQVLTWPWSRRRHVSRTARRSRRRSRCRGRHKKQTGGRAGSCGDVKLRVEPQERSKGFEYVDEVVGGSVPRNFIPAVEKGVIDVMDRGAWSPATRW